MIEQPQVAAVQMTSGADVRANMDTAVDLIGRAADQGARLVVLPENVAFLGAAETDKLEVAEAAGSGWIQETLARAAEANGVWLVAGTIPLRCDEPGRVAASCLVFDDAGHVRARYDKLHMFDVDVGGGEVYGESRTLRPGEAPVVVDTPVGRLGLAICYDLRFPELFRELMVSGAGILAVPAAFTEPTGAAHWELLVRARAVENLCHVVAADQVGMHPSGRGSFGDSMIVDPWGRVLARRATGSGVVTAAVDAHARDEMRQRFPVLRHRRELPDVTVAAQGLGATDSGPLEEGTDGR
jgi:nitrilase